MGAKRSLRAAVVLSACLSSGWAHAEEPASASATETAEIHLKNGESRRGTVVAVEPGQRVIVIIAGEESVIPWSEIATIVGGPGGSAAGPSQEALPSAAAKQAPETGMPFLHIESDWPDAELSRVDGEIGPGVYSAQNPFASSPLHRYICRAPCDKVVDGREGHRFFIMAPGMYPSPHFRLDGYEGHVTARVSGTSFSRFLGGVIGVGTGAVFTIGGGMFFGMSYLIANEAPSEETPDPAREATEVRMAGIGIGAVGLAAVVAGIVLLSAGTTRVELVEGKGGHSGLAFDGGVFRF